MVKEIQDEKDAKERITKLFKGTAKFRLQNQKDIDDYARIAWFLSNSKAVLAALEQVSREIWVRYNDAALKQSPNRFSQAIIRYAADRFGFAVQSNVVFTGALGGPEFLSYVRGAVLWKDTFAPSHGEFSHSFQWLAAGHGLGLGTRTAELYKKAGSVFSNTTNMATRGDGGGIARARQPLWAWLVDCFPASADVDAQIQIDDIYHVFARKYRVPNQITNLALQKSDQWFIGLYVDHRKQWLTKIAERGKELRKTAGESTEPGSNLLGIMKYQQQAYGAKAGWEKQTVAPQGSKFAPSGNVFKKTDHSDTSKTQQPAKFHGIEGTISMRAVSAKTLVV